MLGSMVWMGRRVCLSGSLVREVIVVEREDLEFSGFGVALRESYLWVDCLL